MSISLHEYIGVANIKLRSFTSVGAIPSHATRDHPSIAVEACFHIVKTIRVEPRVGSTLQVLSLIQDLSVFVGKEEIISQEPPESRGIVLFVRLSKLVLYLYQFLAF